MTYLDRYPNCINCPVDKYCGTVVGSIKLCHSYDDSHPSVTSAAPNTQEFDEYAGEQIALANEVM